MKRLILIIAALLCLGIAPTRAQFTDSTAGLLQMPSADMEPEATFMITNNYLNKNALPTSGWGYDTFGYGFSVSFWGRIEVAYVLTLFDGKRKPNATERDKIMFNQDRHFSARVRVLREGDFGVDWLPALVLGVSDPTTGSTNGEYTDADVSGTGNGYFNRWYAAASKHFDTSWGQVGGHLAYQFNKRTDYPLNGPCAAVNWKPIWIQDLWLLDSVNLIAEYDARTFNLGFIASIWDNRFEAMFECQGFKGVNFGLRYKLRLR